jgi:hypothetical protein
LVGILVGEYDGALVVITNEFDVHCIFVSANVAPQDEFPVAYESPFNTAPYKYDEPHNCEFEGRQP